MSRIGIKPITLPAGVEVKVDSNNVVTVKGPKGELQEQVSKLLNVEINDGVVKVTRDDDSAEKRAQHGLARTLINNMVIGVTEGYSKKLLLVGVGYKAEKKGKKLVMNLGYSHSVEMEDPERESAKSRLETILRTSEPGEDLNLTKVKVSNTMAKLSAEKKVRPELTKERSEIKWLKKAETISVLQDTRESEETFMALLKDLDCAFSEAIRILRFRLSTT